MSTTTSGLTSPAAGASEPFTPTNSSASRGYGPMALTHSERAVQSKADPFLGEARTALTGDSFGVDSKLDVATASVALQLAELPFPFPSSRCSSGSSRILAQMRRVARARQPRPGPGTRESRQP